MGSDDSLVGNVVELTSSIKNLYKVSIVLKCSVNCSEATEHWTRRVFADSFESVCLEFVPE